MSLNPKVLLTLVILICSILSLAWRVPVTVPVFLIAVFLLLEALGTL